MGEDSDIEEIVGPDEMKKQLQKVVRAELRKINKNSDALLNAIIDPDYPIFKYYATTRKNGETSLTQKFSTFGLTWQVAGKFAHRVHFSKLQRSLDTMHISCKMRVELMYFSGGFHSSVTDPKILEWKEHNRMTIEYERPENDYEYWWVKVKTDIIGYYWREPNEREIEGELFDLFAIQNFAIEDSLNKCATKLIKWFNDAVDLLKNYGSEKLHDISLLINLFRESLIDKGHYGVQLERILFLKMQEIVENPRRNLPQFNGLTDQEIEDIVGKSTSRLSKKVFRVILEDLDKKGHSEKLAFIVQSVADLRSTSKAKKKGIISVNAATTQPVIDRRGSTNSGNGDKPSPCTTCGMFCRPPPECCRLVADGKLVARSVAGLNNAVYKPQGGGQWQLHKSVIDRLRRWGFPHLKLSSQQEQGKKIDEINQVIKSMYEKDRRGEAVIVNTAVANKSTTKSARRRRQKTKKKDEEDNSSDDDSGEEGNSDESVFD